MHYFKLKTPHTKLNTPHSKLHTPKTLHTPHSKLHTLKTLNKRIMEKEKTVLSKSQNFAVRIIKLYKVLCQRDKTYDLFRQLLRCGTSIGANVSEAECAISKKDFLSKIYISLKECRETIYWLTIFRKTEIIDEKEFVSIYTDCEELRKMLSSITKTVSSQLLTPNSSHTTPHSSLQTPN